MTEISDLPDTEDDDDVPCFKCGQYQLASLPSFRLGPVCHMKIGHQCWLIIKLVLLICLVTFLTVLPAVMLYIGVAYDYCGDMFSTWLITGGVLIYVDSFLFLFWMFLRRKKKVDDITYEICNIPCSPCFLGILGAVSFAIVIWWVFGHARILSGSMVEDPVMEDPACRLYLFTFPFWLCILPYIFLFLGVCTCFAYIVCGC